MRDLALARAVAAGLLAGAIVAAVVGRLDSVAAFIAFELLVVAVAAGLAVLLAMRLADANSGRPPRAGAPARPPSLRPLVRLEHLCQAAADHERHAHHRLRPRLRRIAAAGLALRHVDLDDPADAGRARSLLGADAWEWVRPGRPAPDDRDAPGPGLPQLERAIGALERLQAPP